MAIRVYKPTSPARRFMSVLTYEEVTKTAPEKSLLESKKKNAGRNKQGVQQSAQAGHGQGVVAPYALGEDKGVLRAYGEDKARAHAHALPVCRGDVHGHFV